MAALAEKAGLHQTYISMLESGERSPNISTCKALADAFGIPLSRMVRAAEKKLDEFGDGISQELRKQWMRMREERK
jgi:transcriptional regulator with XRE-family HTH domain